MSRSAVKAARLVAGALAVTLTASCYVPVEERSDELRVDLGEDGFLLSWDPDGPDGTTYEVQRYGAGPAAPHAWIVVGTTTAAAMTDEDVTDGDTYAYRVRSTPPGSTPVQDWRTTGRHTFVRPVLPVIRIDTQARAAVLDKDTYVPGTLTLDPNGSDDAAYSGAAQFKVRGNSTAVADKKPYKIKLDKKAPILGMESEKDWVLLANWYDRSNLRNHAAFAFGQATDLPWTPHDRFVEVVLNGEYRGIYQLTEQVEVSGARVDIDEMEPADTAGDALTGGYLLEVDDRLEANAEPGFRTSRNLPVVIKDPDPAEVPQAHYVRDVIQDFEDRLWSPQSSDPVAGFRAVLDTGSFVDWYLVQELVRNQDVAYSSTYLTKPRGGPLQFGPLWDFDISIGATTVAEQQPWTGWKVRVVGPWYPKLLQDPALAAEVSERWAELRGSFLDIARGLPTTGGAISGAVTNDRARWGEPPEPGSETPEYLQTWLEQRIAWLDSQLLPST